MKSIILYASLLTGCLFSAFSTSAEKPDEKVNDVKCYVEVYGGIDAVVFYHTPKKVKGLTQSIVGDKVYVQGKKHKQIIYRAHECVKEDATFSTAYARSLDDQTLK